MKNKKNQVEILITPQHPFYSLIQNHPEVQIKSELSDLKVESKSEVVLDFTLLPLREKTELLHNLCQQGTPLFTDTSCHPGISLMAQFKNIQGCFSLAFMLPNKSNVDHRYEYSLGPKILPSLENFLTKFFQPFHLQGLAVTSPGIGFTFPRILSLVVNEAYLSLEEKLTSPQDLDMAMEKGANYPLGPLQWGEQIGLEKIVLLLESLREFTGELRYRTSTLLRLESQKRQGPDIKVPIASFTLPFPLSIG